MIFLIHIQHYLKQCVIYRRMSFFLSFIHKTLILTLYQHDIFNRNTAITSTTKLYADRRITRQFRYSQVKIRNTIFATEI